MAKRVTLTNQGLSLLASSSEATGQYYWLGYYALAYVPNLWKSSTVSIPSDDCGNVNSDSLGTEQIKSTDTDQVTSTMTRLTKYGDMIYNIWQGDLNGTGYIDSSSDGSAGGDLFALTLYNTNIKKHYRYVLDENGNNTLVGWIEDPSYSDGTMLGKHVFKGTDGYYSSTLPIPAPVYYLGDVTGKVSVDNFFDTLPTFEDSSGYNGNGSDLYPFITVILESDETLDVPRVSADYRGYTDSQGNPGTFDYGGTGDFETPITDPGTYFNSTEIPYPLDPVNLQFDETSWFAADQTFNISNDSETDINAIFGEEFWKLYTISNYNRYHAPVDSIGNVLNSDLSNRNMAKVTKFFPISNYKVINSESGFTSNSEAVEVATAIKLSIDVDITPRTLTGGFDEDSNIEFFDKYGNPQDIDVIDEYGNNIYNSTHTSFKFNRIGIYAVPLRKAPYVQDQGFGNVSTGENVELEFQINPDDEPVLFAVLDWDNTISMSDTGDGINQFRAEVDVNLESPIGVDDTALLRNTTIFYNMYEDDALHWYQNQLIANASTSNAITEIGLEVAHLKNLNDESKCCPPSDLSSKYAPLNHSHDFLRNLKDSNNALDNGLKGIVTIPEASDILYSNYIGNTIDTYSMETDLSYTYTKLGLSSVVLGEGNAVSGNYSMIGNGQSNYILDGANYSFIGSGLNNLIIGGSPFSIIGAGENNIISAGCDDSFIGSGKNNKIISGSTLSMIGSGDGNIILGGGFNSFIGSGENNSILNGVNNSFIGSGENNIISDGCDNSFIGSGIQNVISGSVVNSAILAGDYNSITNGTDTENASNAVILTGSNAHASIYGEVVHSIDAFSDDGNVEAYNKHSMFMMKGKTTFDSQSVNLINPSSIKLRNGQGFAGTLTVVGYLKGALTEGVGLTDVMYHEIHSISGITGDENYGQANSTSLTYDEYARWNTSKLPESGVEFEPNLGAGALTFTSITADIGGLIATVNAPSHGLFTYNVIRVTYADQSEFNGIFKIDVINEDVFSYTLLTEATIESPTPDIYQSINIITGSIIPIVLDHLPSIVDTVIDYRYSIDMCGAGSCLGAAMEGGNPDNNNIHGYPVISFELNDDNEFELIVDATELYDWGILEDTSIAYWVATFDLTWIDTSIFDDITSEE